MKKKKFLSLLLCGFIVTSCSIFQKDSFEGKWQLKLSGGIDETFDVVVNQDYTFSVSKTITYGSSDYDVELKGKIDKDGKINAEIIASGQSMGNLNGQINFETGKGKWNASVIYGEWTATKK